MRILFVCTGNTCRSLMAEAYARKLINKLGLNNVEVNSCGTYASPKYPIPEIVLKLLSDEGIDVSNHVSTPVTKELVEKSDLIFVMEKLHLSDIVSLYPSIKDKIYLLKKYADSVSTLSPSASRPGSRTSRVNSGSSEEIQDPIGQSEEAYRLCLDETKKCMEKIFEKLGKGEY